MSIPVQASQSRQLPALTGLRFGASLLVVGMTLVGLVVLRAHVGSRATTTPSPWQRLGVVLSPSQAWEQTAVYEPTVLHSGRLWRMWYSGGWIVAGIGTATSPDGIHWTKDVRNPLIGAGRDGVAFAARNSVVLVGGTYYLYYADANPRANLCVATSPDGLHWTLRGIALAKAVAGWADGWANTAVWRVGSHWRMLVEGHGARDGIWRMAVATSADGLRWHLSTGPLRTLAVAPGGAYGGPWVTPPTQARGSYALWYHAVPKSGNLPSNLYAATSRDGLHWTRVQDPVLVHNGTGIEYDQVADPSMVRQGVWSWLYFSGMNNPQAAGTIEGARMHAARFALGRNAAVRVLPSKALVASMSSRTG